MLSKRYLETLHQRGDTKRARCAIKTAMGLALEALESSEAGLEFGGELGQLLCNPAIQEPDHSRLSFQLGDQIVDIIIADQPLVIQEAELGDLGNGHSGAEIIKHGKSPSVGARHVITIAVDVEP